MPQEKKKAVADKIRQCLCTAYMDTTMWEEDDENGLDLNDKLTETLIEIKTILDEEI